MKTGSGSFRAWRLPSKDLSVFVFGKRLIIFPAQYSTASVPSCLPVGVFGEEQFGVFKSNILGKHFYMYFGMRLVQLKACKISRGKALLREIQFKTRWSAQFHTQFHCRPCHGHVWAKKEAFSLRAAKNCSHRMATKGPGVLHSGFRIRSRYWYCPPKGLLLSGACNWWAHGTRGLSAQSFTCVPNAPMRQWKRKAHTDIHKRAGTKRKDMLLQHCHWRICDAALLQIGASEKETKTQSATTHAALKKRAIGWEQTVRLARNCNRAIKKAELTQLYASVRLNKKAFPGSSKGTLWFGFGSCVRKRSLLRLSSGLLFGNGRTGFDSYPPAGSDGWRWKDYRLNVAMLSC